MIHAYRAAAVALAFFTGLLLLSLLPDPVAAAVAITALAYIAWRVFKFARTAIAEERAAEAADAAWDDTDTLDTDAQRFVALAAAREALAEQRFQDELDALHTDAVNWRKTHPDTEDTP